MKKFFSKGLLNAALVASIASALTACNKEAEIEKAMSLKFDPALKSSERKLLVNDVLKLMSFQVEATPGTPYAQIFGGTSTADVVKYLDERINYMIPDNISLVTLPPYSPELNPVERVWLYLRETYLSLRLLDDYDAVVEACCQAWCNLTPDRLRSLTAYPYLQGITG